MFMPAKNPYGAPAVHLAAVGPLMTEVAGEVADGLILHAFTTGKYLREVTLPALEKGLAKSGRNIDDIDINLPFMAASGYDEESFLASKQAVKKQLAFYGSTPAYKAVLEIHGWGGLHKELNRLSKLGRWDEMADLMTDDVLDELAIVEENPDRIAPRLLTGFGDVIDIWGCGWDAPDVERQKKLVGQVQRGQV
jgi:probable F420-dependent oxidoreductase